MSVSVCLQREKQIETQTDTQTETQTDTPTDRRTDTHRRTHRDRHRHTGIDTQKDTDEDTQTLARWRFSACFVPECVFVCMCMCVCVLRVRRYLWRVVLLSHSCFVLLPCSVVFGQPCICTARMHCTCVLPLTCRRKTNSVSKIRCSTIAFRAKKGSSVHISFMCTCYHAREVTISAHQQYMSICRQKRCSSVCRNSLLCGHPIYKSMSYRQAACETPPVANGSLTAIATAAIAAKSTPCQSVVHPKKSFTFNVVFLSDSRALAHDPDADWQTPLTSAGSANEEETNSNGEPPSMYRRLACPVNDK